MSDARLFEWCERHRLQGEAQLLRRLLELRFGALPQWADQRVATAPEKQLIAWGKGLLDKKRSLRELLRA
jgi:hypothetical protein